MKTKKKNKKRFQLLDQVINPDAAGIDVGAEELVVGLPQGRDERPVRTFRTFTGSLYEMRDWLLKNGIKTAAMESTGNYWISAYQILEDAGIRVWLVNARHVKGVPGKKTDVCDAQWLQQLHAAGLLKKSFRPDKEIVPLRYVMRHRAQLVASASEQLQLIQKVFTEMNIKLHHVLSDLDGVSGRAIIEAIIGGQRDAAKLAALRDRRCRASLSEVIASLQGDYREEYVFVLSQCYESWKRLQSAIQQADEKLAAMFAKIGPQPSESLPKPLKPNQHSQRKNSPALPVFDEAWRFYGVDMSTIDGVSAGLLSVLMTELGTGAQVLSAFPSSSAFCSWLGLCPDNRISGGKVLKAKTRKVVNRVSTAFRLAAYALTHSKTKLGDFCRRMKGRLGKAEGITATAHKLARIVFAMITTGQPYDEAKAFQASPYVQAKRIKRLQKQASDMGFSLVPSTSTAM